MTQPVKVNGSYPKTKKALKEAVARDPDHVVVESNAIVQGVEFQGPVTRLAPGQRVYIVGPEPYVRKWYGQIEKRPDGTILVR